MLLYINRGRLSDSHSCSRDVCPATLQTVWLSLNHT